MERLPFDKSFPAAAGEDRDWAERTSRRGVAPRLVPHAVVLHQPGMRVRDFLRQQYRYGKGAARYRDLKGDRRPGSPSFYIGLLRHGLEAGIAPGILLGLAQAATLIGLLSARSAARR
jgi:hypothetical protein